MKDIKIIPIFDQSAPGVWESFAHICSDTMRTNYNYKMDCDEINEEIDKNRRHWRHGTHFAFGAYDGNKMIGYIQGDTTGRWATIQSLYVLFEYQKMHIGRRLLHQAENVAPLLANNIKLVSLSKAESFYRACGYKNTYSNNYTKEIPDLPRCRCLPIFKCNNAMADRLRRVDASFDPAMVKEQHLPVFAYFDFSSHIIGVGVGDRISVSASGGMASVVNAALRRNLAQLQR